MAKRKYTREQLEFYFKRLMSELHRVPREEDISKKLSYPSVTAYVDRFGSWQNAVNSFADFELAKRKCLNCGKVLIKKNKKQKFCSRECQRRYYVKRSTRYTKSIDLKIHALLGGRCFVCDFEHITQVHSLDNKKESSTKILKAYNGRDLHGFVLLCPNHHQMVHMKMARLIYRDDDLVWEEP